MFTAGCATWPQQVTVLFHATAETSWFQFCAHFNGWLTWVYCGLPLVHWYAQQSLVIATITHHTSPKLVILGEPVHFLAPASHPVLVRLWSEVTNHTNYFYIVKGIEELDR